MAIYMRIICIYMHEDDKKITWSMCQDNVIIARSPPEDAYPHELDTQEHHARSSIADPQQHTIFL